MANVLLEYGDEGAAARQQAYFRLVQGKLHIPTVKKHFRLARVELDGQEQPTDPEGFTIGHFAPDMTLRVTGAPAKEPSKANQAKVHLILSRDVYSEERMPDGKRKIVQAHHYLGSWTLPPRELEPTTVAQLAAAVRDCLKETQVTFTQFQYPRPSGMTDIAEDPDVATALRHLRALAVKYKADPAALSRVARLHMTTSGGRATKREVLFSADRLERHLVTAGGFAPFEEGRLQQQLVKEALTKAVKAKKVSDKRHPDGRFKDEVEHLSRLEELKDIFAYIFDGKIGKLVELVDHKASTCRLCNQTITACAAYSVRNLQRHFLDRHLELLQELGVDPELWSGRQKSWPTAY